jgi:hypothetical protein
MWRTVAHGNGRVRATAPRGQAGDHGQFPGIAILPPQWLHVTVQAVWHRPAAGVPPRERARLIDALADAALQVPPFRLQAGSLLAGAVGVVADLHPDDPFDDLHSRVRDAVREVCGDDAVVKDSRPAHMAIGYAVADTDGDEVQTRLRRDVRPGHAAMTVEAIHLVEVTPDPEHGLFCWKYIRRIPIGPDATH